MELENLSGIGPKTLEHLNSINIYNMDFFISKNMY